MLLKKHNEESKKNETEECKYNNLGERTTLRESAAQPMNKACPPAPLLSEIPTLQLPLVVLTEIVGARPLPEAGETSPRRRLARVCVSKVFIKAT